MTKTTKIIGVLALVAGLSSCGVNKAWVYNQNQNATQVHLSGNNFRVVDQVTGTSEISYVLIFGGAGKKQLYEAAYANMLQQADLNTGSRALTNVLTEEQVGGVPPFYYTRTVSVSASIVEFTQ